MSLSVLNMGLIYKEREDESKDIFFYRNPGADILLRADEIDVNYIASAEVFHWGWSGTVIGIKDSSENHWYTADF